MEVITRKKGNLSFLIKKMSELPGIASRESLEGFIDAPYFPIQRVEERPRERS